MFNFDWKLCRRTNRPAHPERQNNKPILMEHHFMLNWVSRRLVQEGLKVKPNSLLMITENFWPAESKLQKWVENFDIWIFRVILRNDINAVFKALKLKINYMLHNVWVPTSNVTLYASFRKTDEWMLYRESETLQGTRETHEKIEWEKCPVFSVKRIADIYI